MIDLEKLFNSETKINPNLNLQCLDCDKPAEFFWPTVSRNQYPLCKRCLENAKEKLKYALGAYKP